VIVPEALRRNVERHPAGPAWLAGLPDLVASLARRWDVVVGAPFTSGVAAWTAPARRRDGADVVLKVSLPHDEARGEAAALRAWSGRGAVRLLDSSRPDWALLLERCVPGTGLAEAPGTDDDRLRTGAHVLRRLLHRPGTATAAAAPGTADDVSPDDASPDDASRDDAQDIADMRVVGERGARVLTGTAARVSGHRAPLVVDDGLVRHAAALLTDLPRSADRVVVVHGDLNPGNVLRAGGAADRTLAPDADADADSDEPVRWLAIDPKPLHGDPAHDPWPLVAQVGDPFGAADPVTTLRRRTRLVAGEVDLDVDRVRAWCLARSVQSAFWYAAEERWLPAAHELARAHVWGRVAG
jgi:streptomycin 6-kinase